MEWEEERRVVEYELRLYNMHIKYHNEVKHNTLKQIELLYTEISLHTK